MEIEEHFFSSGADADFQRLYERYGDLFYDVVDRSIERLRQFPESAPVYEDPVRRLVIQGTPLGLFYGVHSTRLVILAILDLRQDPDAISRRLRGIS
jgi:plasmid stabilization system protein ParE